MVEHDLAGPMEVAPRGEERRPGDRALAILGSVALASAATLVAGWVRGFDDPGFAGSPLGAVDLVLGGVAFLAAVAWVLGDCRWGRLAALAAFLPAAFSYVALAGHPWGAVASVAGLAAATASVWLDVRGRDRWGEEAHVLVLLVPPGGIALCLSMWLLGRCLLGGT
jgi:hypothetical protein